MTAKNSTTDSGDRAFTIRPARPAGARAIHALILELAEYERLLDEAASGSDAALLARHLSTDASPRLEGFTAHDEDGTMIGFALCYRHYSTFHTNWGLYLEDLYVRPAHRGRGIGFALMQRVAQHAHELGCVRLEWQVLTWNESAIDFYERIGAQRMADWTTMRLTGPQLAALANATLPGRVP